MLLDGNRKAGSWQACGSGKSIDACGTILGDTDKAVPAAQKQEKFFDERQRCVLRADFAASISVTSLLGG
jgi:hypothetical protein